MSYDEFKERVRDAVDFVGLVNETVSLPQQPHGGRPVKVLCPFHPDRKTPSLAVYEDHARCYGACQQTWDMFGWAMKTWGCDFRTALDRLAERAGIPRPEWTPEQKRAAQERREITDVLSLVARHTASRLWAGAKTGLHYLLGRGFTVETIRKAGLGYNDGSIRAFLQAEGVDLKSKGARIALSLPVGYVVYPHIEARRVVYLSTRSTTGKAHYNPPTDLAGEQRPYHNFVYTASASEVIVVEGQADAVTLGQWGRPAVALAGSSANERLLDKLKRHKTVFLALDSDRSGNDKTPDLAAALGPLTRLVTWPEGKDANEWLQQGATAKSLADLLNRSEPWLDLRLQAAALATGMERDDLTDEVFGLLAQLEPTPLTRYRTRVCKELRLDNREFYRLLKTAQGEEGEETTTLPVYVVRDGHICRRRTERLQPLCNFTCRIIEEVIEDDGENLSRQYVIEGHSRQVLFPPATVNAEQFGGMKWIDREWGASAIVSAANATERHLKAAILSLSAERTIRRVFTHTGWREKMEGRQVYLSNSGAIGMDGVEVGLHQSIGRYALPLVPDNPREAMQNSLHFLEVAPYDITIPLWATMYLAPLSPIIPASFSLWFFGTTGSLKSTLAALAMSHYGDFRYNTPPAIWDDTANALGKKSFLVKDAPLWIDDYAPQVTMYGKDELERKADRLLRNWGNRTERSRMNYDLGLRATFYPRGIILSTGEQLPQGHSILPRLFGVETSLGRVKTGPDSPLTRAQRHERQRYPHAMTGYLLWLADNWPALEKSLPDTVQRFTDEASGSGQHLRIPTAIAALFTGYDLALTYAQEIGAIDQARREELKSIGWLVLLEGGEAQNDLVVTERPTGQFIAALLQLLDQNAVYLTEKEYPHVGDRGSIPESPATGAKLLGWYDADFWYLIPDAAYNSVAQFYRAGGRVFATTPRALRKQLTEEGILVKTDPTRYTVQLRVDERSRKVLKLVRVQIDLLH